MYNDDFSTRLSTLRARKKVSARDMSLSIGQNPGYINNIESNKALPSMTAFFYICDYLEITPQEFFETDNIEPDTIRNINSNLKKLSPENLKLVSDLIRELSKH